nr:MAG TPA: hypothetical protein [Caudoviricetes sp.]
MRSQSVSSEASISSISSRSSCSSSSGSSVSGTERNAMRVRAVPAANTAAPAINFLELRLIAGRTASLLNLNSTIFSLVSTEVSVVSVMRVSFQIEGSHIRHGFSRGKPIPHVGGIELGSTGNGESLFHHSVPLFVGHQLSAQLCVLVLELPHTVLEGVRGVLLLFVSNGKEDAEDGNEDKGDVEHGLSFRRIFNIVRVYFAKKKDKPRSHGGIFGWKVVGSEVPGLLLAEHFGDDQQGADDDEGGDDKSEEGGHCGSFLRVFNIRCVNPATPVTGVTK